MCGFRETPRSALLVVIAATLVARIVFAWSLGLGIDESYTVATARMPQLSTFDHPPAAWWLAWGASRTFATEHVLAVRLPFIALFALTTWLMFALTALLFGERAGLWAAVTLNLAPVIAWTSGTWVLPDGPLNAALLAGAYCTARAVLGERAASPRWWLAAGACGGLALLSKLHGVFLFAGVGLFVVTSARHRRWLLTSWPYAGAAVAAVMFLPVLVWNWQHEWVSFAFQGGRASLRGINLLGPFVALSGQALFLLPWIWAPLMYGLLKALARGPADERRWLMACLAIGPILGFTAVALTGSPMLYHWAAPGYLMLFPLLGDEVARAIEAGRRGVRIWLAGSAVSLAVVLSAVVAMANLPWPALALPGGKDVPYPLLESLAWDDLERQIDARGLLGKPGLFITATRWHEAGKIDYALHGRMPVLCLCRDSRGYGVLTRPDQHIGEDALIIGRDVPRARVEAVYGGYFERIEGLPPVAIRHGGRQLFELTLYLGRSLRRPPDKPSLLDPLIER